jgi:hypothetical protein
VQLINKTLAVHRPAPQIWGRPEAGFQSSVPNTVIFFPGILEQFGRHSGQNLRPDSRQVVFGVSSRFLREVFGKSRSLPEDFPNTSRRKQATNDGNPGKKIETTFPAGGRR